MENKIKKNRSLYINMCIEILTHLSYNEITFIEDRVFINKLTRSCKVDLKTLDL